MMRRMHRTPASKCSDRKKHQKKGVYKAAAPRRCAGGSGAPHEVCECVFGSGGQRQCMHMHKGMGTASRKQNRTRSGGRKAVKKAVGTYKAHNRRKMCARSCVWCIGWKGRGRGSLGVLLQRRHTFTRINESTQRDNTNNKQSQNTTQNMPRFLSRNRKLPAAQNAMWKRLLS